VASVIEAARKSGGSYLANPAVKPDPVSRGECLPRIEPQESQGPAAKGKGFIPLGGPDLSQDDPPPEAVPSLGLVSVRRPVNGLHTAPNNQVPLPGEPKDLLSVRKRPVLLDLVAEPSSQNGNYADPEKQGRALACVAGLTLPDQGSSEHSKKKKEKEGQPDQSGQGAIVRQHDPYHESERQTHKRLLHREMRSYQPLGLR
jgi:hypothetical protein